MPERKYEDALQKASEFCQNAVQLVTVVSEVIQTQMKATVDSLNRIEQVAEAMRAKPQPPVSDMPPDPFEEPEGWDGTQPLT